MGLLKHQKPEKVIFSGIAIHSLDSKEDKEDSAIPTSRPFVGKYVNGHRATHLIDAFIRDSNDAKAKTWNSVLANLEVLEREEQIRRVWLEQDNSSSSSSLESCFRSSPLPSPVAPRWRKQFSGMNHEKLIECISKQAVSHAVERTWRLENETQQGLIVRKACSCVYCSCNPSPYQTQEYQRLQKCDTSLLPFLVDFNDEEMRSSEALPSLEIPSLSTVYGNSLKPLKDTASITTVKNQIMLQVASEAWNRTVRLQRKGQAHVVRNRCRCAYCRTASPAQTRKYQRWAQHKKITQELLSQDETKVTHGSTFMPPPHISSHSDHISTVYHPRDDPSTPTTRVSKPSHRCQRWSCTSNPPCNSNTKPYSYSSKEMLPPWVSPLSHRIRISYNGLNGKDSSYQTTPLADKIMVTLASPAGVEGFIDAPTVFELQNQVCLYPWPKNSLDGDVDEEQILRDILLLSG